MVTTVHPLRQFYLQSNFLGKEVEFIFSPSFHPNANKKEKPF